MITPRASRVCSRQRRMGHAARDSPHHAWLLLDTTYTGAMRRCTTSLMHTRASMHFLSNLKHEHTTQLLEKLFLEADTDGNGTLDEKEFKVLMTSHDFGLSRKDIKILFTQADVNGDGSVDYAEFIPAAVELISIIRARKAAEQTRFEREETARGSVEEYFVRGMSAPELEHMMRSAFDVADADGNGTLDPDEFKDFLKAMQLNLTKKETNALTLSADANGDGLISYEEFVPVFHEIMSELMTLELLQGEG